MIVGKFKTRIIGSTTYGQNVLKDIAKFAVEEVEGVFSLQGREVRLQINDKKVVVDVFVSVFRDIFCKNVAFEIQKNVVLGIESSTTYTVDSVNVNILSVSFKPKSQRQMEEDDSESTIDIVNEDS